MKPAHEEARTQQPSQKLSELIKDIHGVRQIGQDLKMAGVTQDHKQANLSLVKNDNSSHAAQKNMGVQQGDRPALSPCDGNVQAKEAGQALKAAGVAGGQTQSATKQLAPSHTPAIASPSQGRSR